MRAIFDLLRLHATCAPHKPAVILPDRFVTYGMIWSGIGSVQAALAQLQLDPEKPIAILIDNPARHLIVWLALMRSGFSTASIRSEHLSLIAGARFSSLFTDQRIPAPALVRAHFVDEKWFTSSGPDVEAPFPPTRIARLSITSGSTGRPKVIAITAAAVEGRVLRQFVTGLARGHSSRTLASYGVSSTPFDMLRVLVSGNALVFAPPAAALHTMLTSSVDEVFCSASQARSLVQMQNEERLPLRISTFSMGGGLLSPALADEIRSTFMCEIHNTYASTEASYAGVAYGEALKLRAERGNCFVPTARIEIVDEAGVPVAVGEEGRIRIQSAVMAWPFTGSLVETDDVKGDGWFYPGDIGRICADGLFVVSGRVDEVINTGGVKFAPEVIEEALRRHPKIGDVAIVRMTAAGGEQEVWGAIISDALPTLAEVNRWLHTNFVGELASVDIDRIFTVAEIPKVGAGKIARQELRRILLEMTKPETLH